MEVLIRNFNESDINKLAQIHYKHLDAGVLSQMGEAFLEDFYRTHLNQKNIFIFVAQKNKNIVGFATGAVELGLIPKTIILKLWRKVVLVILKNPLLLFRLIQIPFYPSFRQKRNLGEVLSIVVIPKARGEGIGKRLIESCCREFRKKGTAKYQLSVREKMEDANLFYQKIGLKKTKVVKFLGEKVVFWEGNC